MNLLSLGIEKALIAPVGLIFVLPELGSILFVMAAPLIKGAAEPYLGLVHLAGSFCGDRNEYFSAASGWFWYEDAELV